ncbi:MAG: ATPase [Dehalococcoidaceae bacterium]|nr:ATPase [Dehalococcoidaceae bacterium]
MARYLGIDVGSISTKMVIAAPDNVIAAWCYLPTAGNPSEALRRGLERLETELGEDSSIDGIAVTGSGRKLTGEMLGAGIIKNEITCQMISALNFEPCVQTIVEIGGQDAKMIVVRRGLVADFSMNSVCAAGTGSFLDHQAARLNITLDEMSLLAEASRNPVTINATCTVFAESDMITRQQSGCRKEDIVYGLCKALVANFRRSVIQSKPVQVPVVFQGGVAHNRGIIRAFREEMGMDVIVPPFPELTGAHGAALLCMAEKTESAIRLGKLKRLVN